MKSSVYNLNIEKVKEVELPAKIFNVDIKSEVIHQVVVAQQANSRKNYADTKDKSEVRGGGRKPWRQKGTGRARHGSIRSPLWKGGGVTFGPTNERNFSKKVNKKQKQLALAMCLSDRLGDEKLVIFDSLAFSGKTKDLKVFIDKVKSKMKQLKDSKKFLLVVSKNDQSLIRASQNLNNVKIINADSLNCVDILNHDVLLVIEDSISKIIEHYRKIKEVTN